MQVRNSEARLKGRKANRDHGALTRTRKARGWTFKDKDNRLEKVKQINKEQCSGTRGHKRTRKIGSGILNNLWRLGTEYE